MGETRASSRTLVISAQAEPLPATRPSQWSHRSLKTDGSNLPRPTKPNRFGVHVTEVFLLDTKLGEPGVHLCEMVLVPLGGLNSGNNCHVSITGAWDKVGHGHDRNKKTHVKLVAGGTQRTLKFHLGPATTLPGSLQQT